MKRFEDILIWRVILLGFLVVGMEVAITGAALASEPLIGCGVGIGMIALFSLGMTVVWS